MSKIKKSRIGIIIECVNCRNNMASCGVSRYLTSKNKKNTLAKLELYKYCKYCTKRTIHKEIK